MRYLLSLLCPPLAIFLCGRPFLALISIPLLFCYFPSALLAILVVASNEADRRARMSADAARLAGAEQARAIDRQTAAIEKQTRTIREQTKAASIASAAQTKAIAEAARPREAQPQFGGDPFSEQATSAPELPDPAPALPRMNWRSLVDGLAATKVRTIEAYRTLPEWAQPVVWGLAAATPLSLIMTILFIAYR